MHICFITSEFPKTGFPHGGVGTFVATLGKALVQKGIEVSVVGLNYVDKEEKEHVDGINVYRVTSKKVKGLQWYYNTQAVARQIKEVHKNTTIDFVETAELGLAFLPRIKTIQYGIRMHGGHHFFAKAENRKVEWWKVFQEKRSFRKADCILAVSNYVAETTRELLHLTNKSVKVIYNPIDMNKFHQSDIHKIEQHSLFFAGTLIEKKGIRQLVQSLNYLVDKYPDVHLYIAGRDANLPGTNIPYRPILEKEINEKIKTHITFLGVVPNTEIKNHIERAQICCYPSHMEAMPLAWLEVLAMGKTFIGGITGPGPEAVLNGVTGILANPHDPKDIAEKIKFLFDNPEKGIEMGTAARARVLKEFDIEVIVERNIDFFSKHLRK
jgi:glycosyltransferase involved in cell wall biosynthesis